jgi:integrase/recombinase XerD
MPPIVRVYTRHSAGCPHRQDREWKRCLCWKWLQYNRDGKQIRQPTRVREWFTALQIAQKAERDMLNAELGHDKPQASAITIGYAVTSYLTDKIGQHLADATISKLRVIFEKQFEPFCESRRLLFLRDISLSDLNDWRATWEDGPLATRKKQERIKGFFYFCARNGWITENPALGLSRIKADIRPAVPFTRDEFDKILAACDRFGKTEGQRMRVKTMLLLLRWSGLAIRDAVTLERDKLDGQGRLMLRRAKTGVAVLAPLPPHVVAALQSLPSENARYFFWTGNGLPKSAVADWQRALRRVFTLADLRNKDNSKKRCHPHMLRHTFAVECLLAGIALEDVARLLGHSSVRTTERFYAPWVKSRADRLEEVVKASWN